MHTPMPFPLHEQLRRVLCVTAISWGLSTRPRCADVRAPRFGFAISY